MTTLHYHRHGPRHHRALRNDMKQAFDRLFETANDADDSAIATAHWTPRVDIREDADRFVIHADLPGIDPQDIEVQMDKGILSIRGERSTEAGIDGERYARIERRHGRFHRRFALPDSADAEAITAHGRHGVLEVVIPKKPETTPRRIHVGAAPAQGGDATVQ